jgi:hypothetical protein
VVALLLIVIIGTGVVVAPVAIIGLIAIPIIAIGFLPSAVVGAELVVRRVPAVENFGLEG